MYALKVKGKFQFACRAKTKAELEEKINVCYWNWRAHQEKGSNAPIEDYMVNLERVEITVKRI